MPGCLNLLFRRPKRLSSPRSALQSIALLYLSAILSGTVYAQQGSNCGTGTATAYLDINSTRAAVLNTGVLFDEYNSYENPKDSGISYLQGNGLWISGYINGEHRIVSSTFNPTEFAPGPLGEDGLPVPNCRDYDHIRTISVRDILVYEKLGILSYDLLFWPWHLGAPVIDGDGIPGNYSLPGGDRPRIRGHQEATWIINDDGIGTRRSTSPDIPVQIDMSAYAMASAESYLDNTTIYEYKITNHSTAPLEETYVGLFYHATYANDRIEFTGVDTTLNMVFRYSKDNEPQPDGLPPGALGIDLLQTPLSASSGHELGVSSFVVGYNVNESYVGDNSFRNFLTGHSANGPKFLDGCVFNFPSESNCVPGASRKPTGIMFPGDPITRTPVSMINLLGDGPASGGSGVFLVATGPFTIGPGETETITVAIISARGEDFLDSVAVLREESVKVEEAWKTGLFEAPGKPDKPEPTEEPELITPANGAENQSRSLNLHWTLVDNALGYLIEIDSSPDFSNWEKVIVGTSEVTGCRGGWSSLCSNWFRRENLEPGTQYFWRVRAIGSTTLGPPSETFTFTTTSGDELHFGYTLELSSGQPAFIEVSGPMGTDPCLGDNSLDIGCLEAGGNLVDDDPNSSNDYYINIAYYYLPSKLAPDDFEIRFDGDEHYAIALPSDIVKVPFTAWDIGNVGAFGVNDPSDDVQLIVGLGSSQDKCGFEYGQATPATPLFPDWQEMPSIRMLFPKVEYSEFFTLAQAAFDGVSDECLTYGDLSQFYDYSDRALSFAIWGNPAGPNFSVGRPADGTTIRFLTTPWDTSTPLLSAPINGALTVAQPVTLHWNSVIDERSRLLHHQIEVATNAEFRQEDIIYSDEGRFEYVVMPSLIAGGDYYWRVRSHRENADYSPWSETWHFTSGMPVAAESTDELPTETRLFQNYPNPFRGSTTLTFTTAELARVSLRVYDVLGREVAIILDDILPAGRHQSVWTPGVATGMYFSVLKVGSITQTMPLIHVR